jgi:hypothetical protein
MARSARLAAIVLGGSAALLAAAAVWRIALPAGLHGSDELLEERRARVEQMDTAAKERLLERQERFRQLPQAEQDRLRKLHEMVERDPQADELRAVMRHYYEWLKTVPEAWRMELLGLPPAQRIQQIKRIKADQARKEAKAVKKPAADELRQEILRAQVRGGGKRAAPRDVDALDQWMFDYAARHGPKKVDDLPEPLRTEARQEMARIKAPAFAARVPALVWLRGQLGKGGKPLAITAEELANLRAHLVTPTLKQHLESLPEAEQRQVLSTLMKRLLDWHFANHRFGQSWLAVSDDELADFLEKLDPEQRDKLLRLPNDEMQRELVVRYWRWKLSEELPWLVFPTHARSAASHPGAKKTDAGHEKSDAAHGKTNKAKGKAKAKPSDRPASPPLPPGEGRGEGKPEKNSAIRVPLQSPKNGDASDD